MHILVVSLLTLTVVFLMATRLLPLEIVVLGVPVVLSLTGVLSVEKAFSGFSEPAVIVIISLFILSEGLSRTRVIRKIALFMLSLIRKNPRLPGPTLLISAGLLSMFLNDTGTTALFLPVAMALLRESGLSPRRLLLPMGYIAILGGSSTLIGTSSNVVISGVLENLSLPPFRMFDFFPVGFGALVLGLVYFILLEPWFFRHENPLSPPPVEPMERAFDVGIILGPEFPHKGIPYNDSPLHREIGLLLQNTRSSRGLSRLQRAHSFFKASWDWSRQGEQSRKKEGAGEPGLSTCEDTALLAEGQHLHLVTTLSQLQRLADIRGIYLETVHTTLPSPGPRTLTPLHTFMESEDWSFVQAILNPRSGMVGRKVSSLQFVLPAGVDIIGRVRDGEPRPSSDLADWTLGTSEVLLLQGPREAIRELSSRNIFLTLDLFERETFRSDKAVMALLILGGVVVSNVFGWLPLTLATVLGAILMLLSGCLTMEEARNAIEWRAVMLLGGMFPLGWAISSTGIGNQIALFLVRGGHQLSPLGLLAVLMGTTALLVSFLPHNLVALIMAPIAIDLSRTFHLSPFPLMMGVAFSATLAFLSPLSHPVNTLTWGPGEYRFSDYPRVGAGLFLIVFLWALFEIPRRFPFVHS